MQISSNVSLCKCLVTSLNLSWILLLYNIIMGIRYHCKRSFLKILTYVIRIDWFSRSVERISFEYTYCNINYRTVLSSVFVNTACFYTVSNEDRLQKVINTLEHELTAIIRDGEDVGWSFNPFSAPVSSNNYGIIHWQPLVWVYSNAEKPRVSLSREEEKLGIKGN